MILHQIWVRQSFCALGHNLPLFFEKYLLPLIEKGHFIPGQVNSPAALMTNLCLHWQEALCRLATHFSLVAQTEVDPQGEIHIPFEPSQ